MRRLSAVVPAALIVSATVVVGGSSGSAEPLPDASSDLPWCGTRARPVEEIEAGASNEIKCFATRDELFAHFGVDPATYPEEDAGPIHPANSRSTGAARVLAGDVLWAVHRDAATPGSDTLAIYGPSPCNSSMATQLSGTIWNDRISVTTHYHCGSVKHWQHHDFTGLTQVTNGGWAVHVGMTQAMDDQTTVIRYTA